MGQFESVLIDTLVITIRMGIPLIILFLIGFLIRIWLLPDKRANK